MKLTEQPPLIPHRKITTIGKISFSKNWNRKLNCDYFTTIRLADANKYILNQYYQIWHGEDLCYNAQIIAIKPLTLDTLPEYTAYLDTGLNLAETKRALIQIYGLENINNKGLSVILLAQI